MVVTSEALEAWRTSLKVHPIRCIAQSIKCFKKCSN